MKRSANIETVMSVLKYGMMNRKSKTDIIRGVGLSHSIGKPLLDELAKEGMMRKREDKLFVTTGKGSDYLNGIGRLNKEYGVENVLNTLSKAKSKYYSARKTTT